LGNEIVNDLLPGMLGYMSTQVTETILGVNTHALHTGVGPNGEDYYIVIFGLEGGETTGIAIEYEELAGVATGKGAFRCEGGCTGCNPGYNMWDYELGCWCGLSTKSGDCSKVLVSATTIYTGENESIGEGLINTSGFYVPPVESSSASEINNISAATTDPFAFQKQYAADYLSEFVGYYEQTDNVLAVMSQNIYITNEYNFFVVVLYLENAGPTKIKVIFSEVASGTITSKQADCGEGSTPCPEGTCGWYSDRICCCNQEPGESSNCVITPGADPWNDIDLLLNVVDISSLTVEPLVVTDDR
jgi:hypothetical protein